MEQLPQWVNNFNTSGKAAVYKKAWNTIRDIASYDESTADNTPYEGMFDGESAPVFPHDLLALWESNGQYDVLRATPFGNSLTVDFALEALRNEDLGLDDNTDFLAISFSSTDIVGHKYGVDSKEIQDTYIRLDLDLQRLLEELDKTVGVENYTLFLTADHGAVPVPSLLKDRGLPAAYINMEEFTAYLNDFLNYTYGTSDIVRSLSGFQLFLDHKIIRNLDLKLWEVQETIADHLLGFDGIDQVYTAHQMRTNYYDKGIPSLLQNGYNQVRSGDVLIVLKPGVVVYPETGSTHGSPQIYDTHVPLILYGKGIATGSTSLRTEIPDIAPTLATLMGIAFPNGTNGKPLPLSLK